MVLCPIMAMLLSLHQKRYAITQAACLLLFFILGSINAQHHAQVPSDPNHIANLIQTRQEVSLFGRLTQMPQQYYDKNKFTIEVQSIRMPGQSFSSPAYGKILLSLLGTWPPEIKPGDYITARAVLSPPQNYGVPGAFDYKGYLQEQDIFITGYVRNSTLMQKSYALKSEAALSPKLFFEKIRHKTASFIEQSLPQKTAALYKALLLGDKSGISYAELENYKTAGAMHLLAISGMHLAILALLITASLNWLLRHAQWLQNYLPRQKSAILGCLPLLIIYAGLAGFQLPVQRALIMVSVFMAAILFNRQWCSMNNLALAALIILTIAPASIRSVSFQLSFIATAFILLCTKQLSHFALQAGREHTLLNNIQLLLLKTLLLSIVATLATLPVLLYHFHRFSLLGATSTLLLTPLLCFWALPCGLLGLFTLPISTGGTAFFLKVGALGISFAQYITKTLSALPHASLWFRTPSSVEFILYYLLLLILLLPDLRKRFTRPAILCISIGLLFAAFLPNSQQQPNISFLDVGQGNCTVIELAKDEVIIVDGGGPASERFDVGEAIIAPYLWQKGHTKISELVLTHPHADHYNGLSFLIKRFRPKRIWTSGLNSSEQGYKKLLRTANHYGCKIEIAQTGQTIFQAAQGSIACLINFNTLSKKHSLSTANTPNNRGLLLRLATKELSFLLPGDLETNNVQDLPANIQFKSDVLLMPHHGRKKSAGLMLTDLVQPNTLVISTGKRQGDMGQTPDWTQNGKLTSYNTSEDGSIFFNTHNKKGATTFNGRAP